MIGFYTRGFESDEVSRQEFYETNPPYSVFWGGVTAGVAEYVFEKFSVENLLKIKGVEGWKAKVKAALRQGGIEASEEMLTECANIISDAMVMGERSGMATAINEYQKQGMTEDKAVLQACLDSIGQVAVAGAGGFISGVGMGAGKLGIEQGSQAIYDRLTQRGGETAQFGVQQADGARFDVQTGVVDTPAAKNGVEGLKTQKATSTVETAVKADTTLFDRGILDNLNRARTYFVEYAKAHFPQTVKNQETGKSIGISRKGIDKFLSGRIGVEKYASGFHIPELIERAHKIAQDTNTHTIQAESIPTYEYYDSPIQIEGVDYMAHIRVRNTLMGDKYYGHTISEVDNIEVELSARTSVPGESPAVQPVNAIDNSINSIPQTAQDVNIETGKDMAAPASQPVDPLIADIRSRGAGQTVTQPVDPLIADIRSRGAEQTDAGTEYQIKTLPDGKKYVQADRQVIFGNDAESWSRQLEDYINGKIRRGEDVQLVAADGDILTLTADTAGKVSSQFRGDGTKLSAAEFERKVDAGAHIDELVEVSRSQGKVKQDVDARHGDFASQGWDYRDAYFRDFDGKYYQVNLSVAIGEDGKVVYNIGAMQERSLPTVTGSSAKGGAQNGEKASLGDSVSQSGGEVKSKAGISQTVVQGQTASQPIDPLIADIRSRGAGQTASQPVDPLIADIRSKVAGSEKGLVYDDYVKNELAKETADRINALAKRLNLRVRFVDSIANGVADGQIMDADIQIAKDAQNPAMVVLGHEVGHWLEKTAPREYQTIQQFVSQRQQADINDRIAEYEAVGKELDYDAAQREFVNDYIGEMIANPETLDRFINENRENRSLLQKVADALRALWQKLTGQERQQVKTAEDALLAALRASEKQAAALEKAGQTMDFATEMVAAGAEYMLKEAGGKKVVWISEGALTNKELNSHIAVAEYIAQHIGKVYTILESGQSVYIGDDLPREYTHSRYTSYLRGADRATARAKNKALDGLGELIETATNRRWEKTKHTESKDAKYGMYRYDSTFAFPVRDNQGHIVKVRAYDVELLICNASDGKKYLYDIVNIKENTTAQIDLMENETRSAAYKAATGDDVSMPTIS